MVWVSIFRADCEVALSKLSIIMVDIQAIFRSDLLTTLGKWYTLVGLQFYFDHMMWQKLKDVLCVMKCIHELLFKDKYLFRIQSHILLYTELEFSSWPDRDV